MNILPRSMTRLYNHMDRRRIPGAQNFLLPLFLQRDVTNFYSVPELNTSLFVNMTKT